MNNNRKLKDTFMPNMVECRFHILQSGSSRLLGSDSKMNRHIF